MAGFRFRHLVAEGAPEGARSAWSPFAGAPTYLGSGVSGATGIPVYVAPPASTYDSQGLNPDHLPTSTAIQDLLGVYVFSDQDVAQHIASTLEFYLYRAGDVIGGGRFAGWDTASTPAFEEASPVFVPFDVTNTALKIVPGNPAVTTTKALLPIQPLDVILAIGTDVTKFTGLWSSVNAQ